MKLYLVSFRPFLLVTMLVALAGCANNSDSLVGTHMVQNPGQPAIVPPDEGDIAIAGTQIAKDIRSLPAITAATKPPVIQFTGVTSIVVGKTPVDTDPYTNLLRDRLLTGADNKVRYMERQLPQLNLGKKKKKEDISTEQSEMTASPDYQLLAELQGNEDDTLYKLQVQVISVSDSTLVYNTIYKIRKEEATLGAPGNGELPNPTPEMTPAATAPTAPPQ